MRRTEPAPAATLPRHFYVDADHHARELAAIWYRDWIYVARGDAVAAPRSFLTTTIGTQNILVLRDGAGALKAFYNTCRHRGSLLCREPKGRLPGGRIACPYHAWSYDLDGRLLRTSSRRLPEGFRTEDYPLYPVAAAERGGCLFVNLAGPDAEPFDEMWGRDFAALAHWPLADLQTGHTYEKTIACNWKIFWENFGECLHCPGVHPDLCKLVPLYGRGLTDPRDDPDWVQHADSTDPKYAGGLRAGAASWSVDGQSYGAPFPQLTPEEVAAGQTFATSWPSVFVIAHVDYVRTVRLLPLGPDRAQLKAEWLFARETLADPDFVPDTVTAFATQVMEEDARVCALNQAGLTARAHAAGVLMPEEHEVARFHAWVRDRLARDAAR